MVLPECHDLLGESGSTWMCARSLSFGSFCLATLALGLIGCRKILPVFLSTHWYFTNLCMLALSVLQMVLLVYECFIMNSSKILVVVKYCRGVQIAMSCMVYGKLACDTMNRSKMYFNVLAPIVGATMLLMTYMAMQVVVSEEIDCHNLSWLVMSMTGVILAGKPELVFICIQKYLSSVSSSVTELEQSHHQLWILLVCNLVSNSFQLVIDIYVTYGLAGAQTCNSMFFEDGSGVFEQTVRLVVSVVSYLVPNWATIYVFYVLPRFQFSTALDVPAFENLAVLDRDESAYELLLNEQEKDHI
uniref:THH1/TOM1/TOM3 domain-containing protein n=1 Tax=Globisporangium ultimum (strain ATCC 200006 / CBS 805.95 / DAOM BR144) TaxID=431595 RepID=K3X5P3_GLOUD